jgi:hypothetical protein
MIRVGGSETECGTCLTGGLFLPQADPALFSHQSGVVQFVRNVCCLWLTEVAVALEAVASSISPIPPKHSNTTASSSAPAETSNKRMFIGKTAGQIPILGRQFNAASFVPRDQFTKAVTSAAVQVATRATFPEARQIAQAPR